jgi:hypothetical protein
VGLWLEYGLAAVKQIRTTRGSRISILASSKLPYSMNHISKYYLQLRSSWDQSYKNITYSHNSVGIKFILFIVCTLKELEGNAGHHQTGWLLWP